MSLCKFHHRLLHEGGIEFERLHDRAFRFIKPDGTSFDSIHRSDTQSFNWSDLTRRPDNYDVDEHAALSRWDSRRGDYGLCVEVLLQRFQRERREGVVHEGRQ